MDWCLNREAEATFFSFAVAVEDHAQGGNLFVPGTEAVPDLYNAMLAATAGANPLSFDYEKKGIAFAKVCLLKIKDMWTIAAIPITGKFQLM